MNSSAPGGSGSREKSQPFSKFMRRATKVLKRGSSSKDSVPTTSGATPVSRETGPAESSPAPLGSAPVIAPLGFDPSAAGSSDVTGKPIPEEAAPAPLVPAAISQPIRDTKPSTKPMNARLAITAADSNAIQEEKARLLFAKYGITLEPGEWTAPAKGDGERVEKQIRMRVHRTCHRCQVTFGPEKVCTKCNHNRCKKCPKFPTRKSKSRGRGLGAGAISADDPSKGKTKGLTMPSRVTGKELGRKGPSQRTCHKCDSLLVGKMTRCGSCGHEKCSLCPRGPSQTDKYGGDDPGDKEMYPMATRHRRDVRVHVRWACEKCSTMFKDHEKICGHCGHERCNECTRQPPKKENALDPAAVERIEKRMKEMELSQPASVT